MDTTRIPQDTQRDQLLELDHWREHLIEFSRLIAASQRFAFQESEHNDLHRACGTYQPSGKS